MSENKTRQMSGLYTVADLTRVMRRLRDPDSGCPWDLQQDFSSIVPSTLEECYELIAAIEAADFEHIGEELGDLLFQVVFYAQLGAERSAFDFDRIVDGLVRKLLRRHPHVFANGDIDGPAQAPRSLETVREDWESIKTQERHERSQTALLADIPLALPALTRAQKLQKRAAGVGFDWHEPGDVLAKVAEEIEELRQALSQGDEKATDAEFGDLMFSCVNLARHLGIDAEGSLRRASGKFERRISRMEVLAESEGTTLTELDAPGLEEYWRQAKARER